MNRGLNNEGQECKTGPVGRGYQWEVEVNGESEGG
jgi:hypothetical protein